jgi:uncharacterized protein involved in exopolysaccharide biosynthesis
VQLEGVRQELEKLEQHLSQSKERYSGEISEQLPMNLAALESANTQLRLNKERQGRTNERRTGLILQLAGMERQVPGGEPGAVILPDSRTAQRDKLQLHLVALRTRFQEKHPEVVRLKEEIAALEQLPAEIEPGKGKEPGKTVAPPVPPHILRLKAELGTLEAEIKGLQTEEHDLLRSVALYQQRIENTPRREQELQILLRDYTNTKELYQSLLKRQEEAKLAESLEQHQTGEQFRLLDPAVPAPKPVAPNRQRITMVGLLVSVGLAVGVLLLAEQRDTSFHSVEDLRAFSPVPVLGSLPRLVARSDARQRRWRFVLATMLTVLSLILIGSASHVVVTKGAQLVGWLAQVRHLQK